MDFFTKYKRWIILGLAVVGSGVALALGVDVKAFIESVGELSHAIGDLLTEPVE